MSNPINCSDSLFPDILPRRVRCSNKRTYGMSYIIAGSYEYGGAPLLSYNALLAVEMGVGYSVLVVPNIIYDALLAKEPEIILKSAPCKDGRIAFDEDYLREICQRAGAISIGMGMGVSKDVYDVIAYLLKHYSGKLVIDADGLNSVANFGVDILKEHIGQVILTPHIYEFSRLSKLDVNFIKDNSQEVVEKFAKEYGVTVILKDAYSLISDGTTTYLNKSGTSGLAKAGSGDMLSGILTGLLVNSNKDIVLVAAFASYLLGKCAEEVNIEKSDYSMLARDVIAKIPEVLKTYL